MTFYDRNGDPVDHLGRPCPGPRAPWSHLMKNPSPMGYQGQVHWSTADKVVPAGVATEVLRWVGAQELPSPGVLYIAPSRQASQTEIDNFGAAGSFLEVAIEQGQTRYVVAMDLRATGIAVQLVGSTITAKVNPGSKGTRVQASLVAGYSRAELLRPTLTSVVTVPPFGGGTVVVAVPPFAQRVTIQPDQVSTIIGATPLDKALTPRGVMSWAGNGQGPDMRALPGGVTDLRIGQTGLVATECAVIFELGI